MIPPERQHVMEPQHLSLLITDLKGRILDIGGGGEGIMGRMHPDRVIAVDPSLNELLEARGLGTRTDFVEAKRSRHDRVLYHEFMKR